MTHVQCTFLTICLGFYLLHYLVCYNVKHQAIVVILAVRSRPSSSVACWSFKVFVSRLLHCTHRPRASQPARRKENSEAADLADFALCCCNAQLAIKKREGLSWFCNFLRTLVRNSWSTVSNSPGALCRISSSVAGLIPGERTSAPPRSVLQISDRHLRRYSIHKIENLRLKMAAHGIANELNHMMSTIAWVLSPYRSVVEHDLGEVKRHFFSHSLDEVSKVYDARKWLA